MDNWLLIIVAVIFVVCIVVGYVRGFLKFGLSLLSTVLTLVLVAILSPYVADALANIRRWMILSKSGSLRHSCRKSLWMTWQMSI